MTIVTLRWTGTMLNSHGELGSTVQELVRANTHILLTPIVSSDDPNKHVSDQQKVFNNVVSINIMQMSYYTNQKHRCRSGQTITGVMVTEGKLSRM